MATAYKDIQVYLTDFKGNVTYSTDTGVLRQDFARIAPDPTIHGALQQALSGDFHGGDIRPWGKNKAFVAVNSVANEPSCHHCHGASKPILGAMIVAQDITPELSRLASDQLKSAGLSLGGLLALLAVLLLFMKRSVVGRVQKLAELSDAISKGSLELSFHVPGRDEIAALGNNLSTMVRTIKDQLEYNRGILNGVIIPIFVADRERRFEFANTPLQKILGKPEAALLGQPVVASFMAWPVKNSWNWPAMRPKACSCRPARSRWPKSCLRRTHKRPSSSPTPRPMRSASRPRFRPLAAMKTSADDRETAVLVGI